MGPASIGPARERSSSRPRRVKCKHCEYLIQKDNAFSGCCCKSCKWYHEGGAPVAWVRKEHGPTCEGVYWGTSKGN